MNVGEYSGATGMRLGEQYQQLIAQNLSLQSVPGYKQMIPVFSTDQSTAGGSSSTNAAPGNANGLQLSTVIDFSQGPIQPSGNPYHLAIQGQSFFEVREADGTTTYTRNGSFSVSPQGQVKTSDGATVLGAGGSALSLEPATASSVSIASDGTISAGGATEGKIDFAHFDNPSASLQPGPYGRYVAAKSGDAKEGLAPGDQVMQNSLEQSNGNPVEQMADMIQAVRLYEANQKSIQAVDDTQNQLVTNLGSKSQG
jgi:flagellar basal body rod protein FlgG